jgi:hypothetical protein
MFDRFACSIGFASRESVEWLIESIELIGRFQRLFPN